MTKKVTTKKPKVVQLSSVVFTLPEYSPSGDELSDKHDELEAALLKASVAFKTTFAEFYSKDEDGVVTDPAVVYEVLVLNTNQQKIVTELAMQHAKSMGQQSLLFQTGVQYSVAKL